MLELITQPVKNFHSDTFLFVEAECVLHEMVSLAVAGEQTSIFQNLLPNGQL